MEKPAHRTWMYNRLLPRRKGYTTEFLEGVKEFIDFACQQPKYLNEGVIKCPCKLCKNKKHLSPAKVNDHIIKEGFTPRYWYWTSHGEKVPQINNDVEVKSVPPGSKNTLELSAAMTMLNMSQACLSDQAPPAQPPPQSHSIQATQPQLPTQSHSTQPTQPQLPPQSHTTISQCIPTQAPRMEEYPMINKVSSSSSSQVSEGNNVNKIMILPEGDGFDQHKLVVGAIASIIRTNLEEAKPSWKQLSIGLRDSWFNIFKSKFTWPPQHMDMVRRNFEKRGSSKMTQLMQEVRKNLNQKPTWMKDGVWVQLKEHWQSSSFKNKSEINKRNRESMDGACLHTGGSIPHHLHWKRMKEEKGTDPSLTEFYFRTHRRKKDQSWVGRRAESAYDKFEQRKLELSSKSSKYTSGKDGADSQPSMPSDFDIWVKSVGKKKGRIFGLGSIGKTLFTSSSQPMKFSVNSEEVDTLRNQLQELNESVQRQEQDKLEMRQKLTQTEKQGSVGETSFTSSNQPTNLASEEVDVLRKQVMALSESIERLEKEKLEMRQELTQIKQQVTALIQLFGLDGSSHPCASPQNSSVNDDDDSDTISDHID